MLRSRITIITGVISAVLMATQVASAKTAIEFLRAADKPVFREGHTLIPLSRWGWSMPFDVRVELCERWGYALEFGGEVDPTTAAAVDNPNSEAAKLCALTASNPKKYPLSVIVYRGTFHPSIYPGGNYPEETFVHDAQGKRLATEDVWKTWSPEMPDLVYEKAAEQAVAALAKIQTKAPIAILLHGGENGLNCRGHSGPYWEKDPKVIAAKGDLDWDTYIGRRKAHYEMIYTNAVRKQVPDRLLYLWYHFGSMPGTDVRWVWDYKAMKDVSDMPGQMFYYNRYDNTGWVGKKDMLTNALYAHALCLEYGQKLGYHWLCAGWEKDKFSDRQRYMGFLKSLYNTGTVGAVAGYFSFPNGGFGADLGDEVPSWLWQMMDLGQVQALYSHVDDFLREGELLAGPDRHRYATSTKSTLSAYEFPTNDPTARVLVRKHSKRNQWLVTAWAADGPAREVTVFVPEVGSITVEARPCGSVYRVSTKINMPFEPPEVTLELLDPDGMKPTATFTK